MLRAMRVVVTCIAGCCTGRPDFVPPVTLVGVGADSIVYETPTPPTAASNNVTAFSADNYSDTNSDGGGDTDTDDGSVADSDGCNSNGTEGGGAVPARFCRRTSIADI